MACRPAPEARLSTRQSLSSAAMTCKTGAQQAESQAQPPKLCLWEQRQAATARRQHSTCSAPLSRACFLATHLHCCLNGRLPRRIEVAVLQLPQVALGHADVGLRVAGRKDGPVVELT